MAPDVYKIWPRSEQQSQHMPVQPQKACQKPPPPQRRLGKQGQRPRTVKSFHPQHQSLWADCLGMLFLKIQKIKWTPSGGGQACTPGALLVAHQALSASWGTLRLSEGKAPHHAPAISMGLADSSRCRPVPQCKGCDQGCVCIGWHTETSGDKGGRLQCRWEGRNMQRPCLEWSLSY